jgi:hypothetical protein
MRAMSRLRSALRLGERPPGEPLSPTTRAFYAILGPVAGADLQHFSDWLTGCGAANDMPVFRLGDSVLILDGPFADVVGIVEDTDIEHCRLKASVDLFGRRTNVVLPFSQVECIAA